MSRQLPFGGSSFVATSSFKLKVQGVFPSLATLTSSAPHKSISHNNSYMNSIHFSENANREKNASLFSCIPSCKLLKLSISCSSHFSFHVCKSILQYCQKWLKQKVNPILIANKSKRLLIKIQKLKLGIQISYGLPPINCSVLSP